VTRPPDDSEPDRRPPDYVIVVAASDWIQDRYPAAAASLTRISMQRIWPSGLAELEAQAAVLPPGDGGVGAQVGLAQDG
jgi:hypothetical protein